MNLKKAFQYQRLIRCIQQEIVNDAMDDEKFEVVEENHKRSELNFYFNDANKTYSDELKVRKSKNVRGYDFAKLVMVYEYLVSCREKLAEAISEVKNGMSIGPEGLSYDAAVLRNSDLRELEFSFGICLNSCCHNFPPSFPYSFDVDVLPRFTSISMIEVLTRSL